MEAIKPFKLRLQNFCKILALRLQKALPLIIHPDQVGFIKGRHLAEDIMKLLNLMEYCELNKNSSIILTLDFEKAFNKLEWNAIYKAYDLFEIGPKFKNYVKTLYSQPVSCSINNGNWSEFYTLTRGTRQGCPLSALNFVITIEILGIKLRINPEIKGVDLNSYEIRNNHYADDLWIALDPTSENIDAVLRELEKFRKFSGLTTNYEKSTAMIIGPLRDTDMKFYMQKQLAWAHKDKAITILGMKIHPDWKVVLHKNYYKLLNKMELILKKWVHRSLMIMGKITLLNNLIATQLTHKFLALPTPDRNFFTKYRQLITKFLWGDAIPKIAYQKLIQKHEKGGLALTDIEAKNHALKTFWITKWRKLGK